MINHAGGQKIDMLVRHRLACAALVLGPMLQPPPPMPLQGGVQGAPPISVRTAVDLPWIPGHEFSGVVEQVGSDVGACAPGDAGFGTSGMGAYAEYLAVKPATIARHYASPSAASRIPLNCHRASGGKKFR